MHTRNKIELHATFKTSKGHMSGAKHNVNPADYGWTYLGSNAQSRVEYWVNDQGAKMDYYPTTGTVKTSMEHPYAGKTQMFRRNLSDSQFTEVLNNPRAHTGQGYQTKANWNKYHGK